MDYAAIEWRDGLPYSLDFDDVYFSDAGGRSESEQVFLGQNDLHTRFAAAKRFTIAEIGFGAGLNLALTLKLWQAGAPENAQLDYFAIEFAPLSPEDIRRVAANWPELEEYFEAFLLSYPLPVEGRHLCCLYNGRVRLHFAYMDVCEALDNETLGVNAWFLDGFAPAKNSQIWNQKVYELIAQNSAFGATLATYSVAGAVRRGLTEAGFNAEKRPGHGRKREMLFARLAAPVETNASVEPWFRSSQFDYKHKQAVILGAGLAGLSVAWSLVRRGWTVTVVDRNPEVASQASGNPVGLVMPRPAVDNSIDAQFYAAAFLHAVITLDLLQAEYQTGTGNHLWHKGGVYYAMESQRLQQLLERNQFYSDYLRLAQKGAIPIRLKPGDGLLFLPKAGWASPRLVCEAINMICGKSIHYLQADISSLYEGKDSDTGRWQLMVEDQKMELENDVLVLANGVNATQFSQTGWMPIQSVRGQLSKLELRDAAIAPQLAYSAGHYLAPTLDDERIYYCGASYHIADGCGQLRDSDQDENRAFAEYAFPDTFISKDKLEGRVGFRAVSNDRLPIVGQVPDATWYENNYADLKHGRPACNYEPAKHLRGLYISAAHASRGMTSCFLSAEIIASQIEGSMPPVSQETLASLNPARFIIRRLKRGA